MEKSVVRKQLFSTFTAAKSRWAILNEASGSSLPTSVSGGITSFLPFICMWYRPHFTAQFNVVKDNAENSGLFSPLFVVVMIVLNQFIPLALNQLTTYLPTKEGKQTSQ